MNVPYSLSEEEEENKEEETNVMPNSGTIRKPYRIKKIHHQLNWMMFYGQFKPDITITLMRISITSLQI